ncbi:MAG: hypothetical protein DWH97_09170 [Planctomycetota bacterium]|nr:MAG: hypothetical protein DWH97_09170 [Planctomycetota bacterium]
MTHDETRVLKGEQMRERKARSQRVNRRFDRCSHRSKNERERWNVKWEKGGRLMRARHCN